jgi:hypothetical protein
MVANPSIVSGVRGITDVVRQSASPTESEWDRAVALVSAELKTTPLKKGERMFMSRSRSYRLQCSAPLTTYDPVSKQAVTHAPRAAQFKKYLFRTDDPYFIKEIEKARAYGSEMHDAEVVVRKAQERTVDDLVNRVANAPENLQADLIEKLIGGLGKIEGKKSVALPKREEKEPAT